MLIDTSYLTEGERQIMNAVKEPKNAIYKQYQKLFKIDGIDLVFDDEALNEIAKLAIERNTGARGLRSIIENVMMKPMFEIPSIPNVAKVTVTKDYVTGNGDILIEYAAEQTSDATPEEASKI